MPLKKLHLDKQLDSETEKEQLRASKKSKSFKKFYPFLFIVSLIFIISLIWSLFFTTSSVIEFVFNEVFSEESLPSTNDRINILLLGMAGGGHDGATLTDTIIVASIHLKNKKAMLFSVPRDLWLEDGKHKVNATYEYGLVKDQGLFQAKESIGKLMGLKIHFGLRVDFAGFAKAIDLVEGVDVEVPKTFDDYNYPITGKENDSCGLIEKEVEVATDTAKLLNISPGKRKVLVREDDKIATESSDFACRFEHLHFDKGKIHLDGEMALKFVRSRMGTNGEGSDFARSRRQQKVLESFRSKVLSLPTLANPSKIIELINAFQKSLDFDIPKEKFLNFYNLSKDIKKVESVVLGDLGGGKTLFINPDPANYGGAWVLIPEGSDYSKVSQFVREALVKQEAEVENK